MWEKLDEKKIHFFPSKNLDQILPESGSWSALDPDPHKIKADTKHCIEGSRLKYKYRTSMSDNEVYTAVDLEKTSL
jgi:hypothetical protein